MVSYLNCHDALEQRRRAAREASTSDRPGPRAMVSAAQQTPWQNPWQTPCVSARMQPPVCVQTQARARLGMAASRLHWCRGVFVNSAQPAWLLGGQYEAKQAAGWAIEHVAARQCRERVVQHARTAQ
jgi:hypothetical protein